MNPFSKFIIVFLLMFSSCSNEQQESIPQQKNTADKVDVIQKNFQEITLTQTSDTIEKFVVDDYPLTDDMFGKDINGRKIKSGEAFSFDKVWFTNESLKQTIVVELYTDNFRMVEFHFQNQDIPSGLIERMELHTNDGQLASQSEKVKNFRGFITAAVKIDSVYFTTNKGFQLGDDKQKALKIYGEPSKTTKEDNVEILEWNFMGDITYSSIISPENKLLAKNSFGHQTIMFFKNNKLIALIFNNDIP